MRLHRLAAAVAVLALGPALWAQHVRAEHEQFQKWLFATTPTALPAAGMDISHDTGRWILRSGTVRLMQPAGDGRITGFVFDGDGTFSMDVPDKLELAQLARFARKPGLERFEQSFTAMVFRASDRRINDLFAAVQAEFAPHKTALTRHEAALVDRAADIDARVIAAMLNAEALYISADMNTRDFGWVNWEYDSADDEEITLTRVVANRPESWLSIDRAADRRPDGRPGVRSSSQASLKHVDLVGDLRKYGSIGPVGQSHQPVVNGHYSTTLSFTPLQDGLRAVRLRLNPFAQKLSVRDEGGAPLEFLRDAIGKRSALIDNRFHSPEVTIVMPEAQATGRTARVTLDYDLETGNFGPGGGWYPMFSDDVLDDLHTARLELTTRKRFDMRAMGRRDSERETDTGTTAVWVVDKPTRMVTFTTADHVEEVVLNVEGIPQIVSFAPAFMRSSHNRVRNVAVDVANSAQFFQNLFDDKLGGERFYVTSIAARHGQAFESFLHMSEATFRAEVAGASELFRAHETAHEWWGHKVGWKSYRDQWLSESFAEYSAMMFVGSQVKGGKQFFEEMLDAHRGVVLGNLSGGFSKFARWGLIEFNEGYRDRLGPIGHGIRASTREIPAGYIVQAYHKGPLVVHMMRMLLRYATGNDDVFVKILRDFVREYSGKNASTDDLRRTVERNAPGDWRFFFDTWIYRADIPEYRWSHSISTEGDQHSITIKLRRTGVPKGWISIVPIRVVMDNGKSAIITIVNNQDEQTVVHKLSGKPREVTFAPDHSLLAEVRKE